MHLTRPLDSVRKPPLVGRMPRVGADKLAGTLADPSPEHGCAVQRVGFRSDARCSRQIRCERTRTGRQTRFPWSWGTYGRAHNVQTDRNVQTGRPPHNRGGRRVRTIEPPHAGTVSRDRRRTTLSQAWRSRLLLPRRSGRVVDQEDSEVDFGSRSELLARAHETGSGVDAPQPPCERQQGRRSGALDWCWLPCCGTASARLRVGRFSTIGIAPRVRV